MRFLSLKLANGEAYPAGGRGAPLRTYKGLSIISSDNFSVYHRLSATPQGSELFRAHFNQPEKFGWVQTYVFVKETLSEDMWQALRKTGLCKIELVKEHVPTWLEIRKTDALGEIQHALQGLFGDDVKIETVQFNAKNLQYNHRKRLRRKGGPRLLDQRASYAEYKELKVDIRTKNALKLENEWKGSAAFNRAIDSELKFWYPAPGVQSPLVFDIGVCRNLDGILRDGGCAVPGNDWTCGKESHQNQDERAGSPGTIYVFGSASNHPTRHTYTREKDWETVMSG